MLFFNGVVVYIGYSSYSSSIIISNDISLSITILEIGNYYYNNNIIKSNDISII